MRQISWTSLPRTLDSEVPCSIGKVQATFIQDRGLISHAICGTSTSRVSQGGSLFRPLLKPQSSFQFSLPTELKSSRAPSTWQFQRYLQCTATRNRWQRRRVPANSRSVLLGVALEKTPLGLPNTDFSCPNGIVDCHIELHSFLPLFSHLHISPDFYGFQDVENCGALLPLLGELVWVRSLSLRSSPPGKTDAQQIPLAILHTKRTRQCPLRHRKSLHGLKSLCLREMSQSHAPTVGGGSW
jgi:hypothetical protein